MYRNEENTLMSVANETELPENIRRFYHILDESDRVISTVAYGKNHMCMKNLNGERGLFHKDLLNNKGEMYLPSMENAPLFIKTLDKIVVIAPCVIPDAVMIGVDV